MKILILAIYLSIFPLQSFAEEVGKIKATCKMPKEDGSELVYSLTAKTDSPKNLVFGGSMPGSVYTTEDVTINDEPVAPTGGIATIWVNDARKIPGQFSNEDLLRISLYIGESELRVVTATQFIRRQDLVQHIDTHWVWHYLVDEKTFHAIPANCTLESVENK